MFCHRSRIEKRDKYPLGTVAFSLGSLFLLLWLGIRPQPLGAALIELPAQEVAALEEAVRPVSKTGSQKFTLLQQERPPLESLDGLRRVTHRARPGDTLTELLVQFGLSKSERQMWLRSMQKHNPIEGLRAGKEVHFYFAKPSPSLRGQHGKERLKAVEIEQDGEWILTWEKGNRGIVFGKRERPYNVELKAVGGVVERSLFEDGSRLGLNQSLLSQLADMFAWEIDFSKEIQKGDTFKLIYEERSRKGRQNKTSFRILAAEFINTGQQHFAIYFEKERGKGGYYDLDGRSLARAFLRFPLEFTSISTFFSHSRFHPILKVDRPHYGVDFAAKRGTPVRAVGAGKILYAGWGKGGYGRMVEIQHDSAYASRYAHLQRLAQRVRKGAAIKKGQIIGYVGSSGRSTGAHLHFELYKDREYMDPLKFEFPPEDRIEPALRRVFESTKQLFIAELAATPHS